jgi:hypothetical protein
MAAFQTVLCLAARTEGLTYAELYAAGSRGRWKHPGRAGSVLNGVLPKSP